MKEKEKERRPRRRIVCSRSITTTLISTKKNKESYKLSWEIFVGILCWDSLLVVGCWLLVVGYWLLVVGCWLHLLVGSRNYFCNYGFTRATGERDLELIN